MFQVSSLLHRELDTVRSLAISPDDRLLAVGLVDGKIQLWDLAQLTSVATLYHDRYMCHVDAVAFSPDGRLLASGACGAILLWDVATRRPAGTIPYPHDPAAAYQAWHWEDHERWYDDYNLGEDNQQGRGIWYFPYPGALAFSPDGQRLAAGAEFTGGIVVWDLPTGRKVRELRGHTWHVCDIAFSPDGKLFASASHDTTVRLWDRVSGQCIQTLTRHTAPVTAIAFSPDSTTLASSGLDGSVRLWDCRAGDEQHMLHSPAGWSLAYRPDGDVIASGQRDGTVRIWEATTGQLKHELPSSVQYVDTLSFTHDGQALVIGGWYVQLVADNIVGYPIEHAFGAIELWKLGNAR